MFDKNKILGPWFEWHCDLHGQKEHTRQLLGRSDYIGLPTFIWLEDCGAGVKKLTANSWIATGQSRNPDNEIFFDSVEEARKWFDDKLLERGYKLVSQEQFDKLSLLL
jgi:hypothetical protein